MNTLTIDRRAVGTRVPGPFLTIVRFTLVDGLRSRWGAVMAMLLVCALAVASFGGGLSLTESEAVSLVAMVPALRLAAVLALIVFVVAASVFEFAEGSVLLALAAPLSRPTWVLAKFTGFALMALVTALVCSLPVWLLHLQDTLAGVAAWTVSLVLELMLVAALALAMSTALRQVPAAILATTAVYLLARTVGAALLLSDRVPVATDNALGQGGSLLLQIIGIAMPRLDLFAQTGWLLGAPLNDLPAMLLQALLYGALGLTIAALDLGGRDV